MTYSLKLWTNPSNETDVRLYVEGTSRSGLYFVRHKTKGTLVWSSPTLKIDGPKKSSYYARYNKDADAAAEVADAFGLTLGEDDWDRAVEIAVSGLEIEE